jgi:hypothetical protein
VGRRGGVLGEWVDELLSGGEEEVVLRLGDPASKNVSGGAPALPSEGSRVTPQVSVHLNTYPSTLFNLKRTMGEINSKRRGQIKVKVNKRN